MTWDADSLNKIADALNTAYTPHQVFRALDFTGHAGRECGEHRSTGPRAWCHDCTEWCYPDAPCKGCEVPQLRARVAELEAERDHVEDSARIEIGELRIRVAALEAVAAAALALDDALTEEKADWVAEFSYPEARAALDALLRVVAECPALAAARAGTAAEGEAGA